MFAVLASLILAISPTAAAASPVAVSSCFLDGASDERDCNGNSVPDSCDLPHFLFPQGESYPTGAVFPGNFELADGDSDGDLDAFVAAGFEGLLRFTNQEGSFLSAERIFADTVLGVAARDVDADGAVDLAVQLRDPPRILVLWNDGLQGFSSGPTLDLPATATSITAAELDDQSGLDLLVSLSQPVGKVWVFPFRDGRSFAGPVVLSAGLNPAFILPAPLDDDADLDLVVVNGGASGFSTVSILENDGAGRFLDRGEVGVQQGPTSAAAGDFDGDGDLDLAVTNYASRTVSILRNDGALRFEHVADLPTEEPAASVGTVDADGDGALDLLVATSASGDRGFRRRWRFRPCDQ